MRRTLFNLSAALSVMACLFMLLLFGWGRLGLGVRTAGRQQLVGRWYWRIYDSRSTGHLGLAIYHDWPAADVAPKFGPGMSYTPEVLAWYDRLPTGCSLRKFGFGYDHLTYLEVNSTPSWVARGRYVFVGVPFWAADAVWLTPIPFAIVIRRRFVVRARLKRGQCVACGYDLRATRNQCPECGAVPQTAAIA